MRRIHEARKEGKSEHIIKERTAELFQYLESQGLANPYDE